MKASVGRRLAAWCLLAATAVGGGCAPSTQAPPPAPQTNQSMAMDPCAEQLHDIAGLMLQYYAAKHELPPTLDELKAIDPGRPELFVCPTSGQAYVYDPHGVEVASQGKLVLSDATPAHHGLRWGIVVQERRGSAQPLITKIIAVPADVGATKATPGSTKAPWD